MLWAATTMSIGPEAPNTKVPVSLSRTSEFFLLAGWLPGADEGGDEIEFFLLFG
jgi:hypothetical protein